MAIVTVAPGTDSGWVATPGGTNIAIGVRGSSYFIDYHLGTDSFPFSAYNPAGGATTIARAEGIRVTNTGKADLRFEIAPLA